MLKKIVIATVLVCGLFGKSEAQCIEEGNSLVDVYYGAPYLYRAMLTTLVSLGNGSNAGTFSGFGPVGFKYEYEQTDLVGIGVEVNYASLNYTWMENQNTYTLSTPVYRLMFSTNFHYVKQDNFEIYSSFKVGFYRRTFIYSSTDPTYHPATTNNLIPLAFRLETGYRYYFSQNVGIHLNVGLGGGPPIEGGLSFKF